MSTSNVRKFLVFYAGQRCAAEMKISNPKWFLNIYKTLLFRLQLIDQEYSFRVKY